MQVEHQSQYPYLYSVGGFRYCDLLLTSAERVASGMDFEGDVRDLEQELRGVQQRASKTLEWLREANVSILSIALDHLTLGRVQLYGALIQGTSVEEARQEIESAVDGLRQANTADHIPRGLLTRAWLRSTLGDDSGARADLDEVEQIARRGPMPLFLADVHLYRARLFQDRDSLREARRLVDAHGYGRRVEELVHWESVAVGWDGNGSTPVS